MQNPLNEYGIVFPLLESVHLLGILCGVGAAAIVCLRLLGAALAKVSPASLWSGTLLLTAMGLTVAIFSGFLLFSIDPAAYYSNPAFHFKMTALAAAMIFYYTMVRRAARRDAKAPVVAAISLVLFALVPLGGVLIGYE